MKTLLLLIGLSFTASAQTIQTVANISQEPSIRFKTNGTYYMIDGTNKIRYDEIVTEQAPVQVIRLLVGDYTPVATNRVAVTSSVVQKPLLSAQPRFSKPVPTLTTNAPAVKPTAKIPGPSPTTNTNSPAYRRAHKLPPFDK